MSGTRLDSVAFLGRPLRAEDLRQFFEENFQRVYRAPRGDCLTYCRGFRKFSGEHVTHVYYGTQNHCEIGVGIGICVGASYYEYYVDKVRESSFRALSTQYR